MIAYDVTCDNGHVFEGWFANAASFEEQKTKGLIDCPYCKSTHIERVPSTFAIGGKRKPEENPVDLTPKLTLMWRMQRYIEKNFEDVGKRFAEEALKIHYGDGEQRNIRGTTTEQEEHQLKEEGVTFIKIPIIRYDD